MADGREKGQAERREVQQAGSLPCEIKRLAIDGDLAFVHVRYSTSSRLRCSHGPYPRALVPLKPPPDRPGLATITGDGCPGDRPGGYGAICSLRPSRISRAIPRAV